MNAYNKIFNKKLTINRITSKNKNSTKIQREKLTFTKPIIVKFTNFNLINYF